MNQVTNVVGSPIHDEYSHGADAFRYLGVVADALKNEDEGTRKLPVIVAEILDSVTMY